MDVETLQGQPASILGLGGHQAMDTSCAALALEAGINYFFFYNLSHEKLLSGLKPIVATQREQVLVATGSSDRNLDQLRQYLEQVRRYLDVDVVDVFFAEYINPSDDITQVGVVLDELCEWKERGLIRYVGATTHNRAIALELINSGKCELLMHRYNMAHPKAQEQVFPMAQQADIPVVAFTCTRWGKLLQGHPNWQGEIPTAADCYRYALHQKAVRLALTAPQTPAELEENLSVFQTPELSAEEVERWEEYGALVYGDGQDRFETGWL
ncbi:MAG: aldo/keto reductase [Symploca sp. SIO2C1]|nr:aldo/keto reductase [Symploca sp. SIO2C1]